MVSKLTWISLEFAFKLYRLFNSMPMHIIRKGNYLTIRRLSWFRFILWFTTCVVLPVIMEIHFIVFAGNRLTQEDKLENLEMQQTVVCLVFAAGLMLTIFMNTVWLWQKETISMMVCEALTIDAQLEGINLYIFRLKVKSD